MIITPPAQYKELLNRLVAIIRKHAGKACPSDKQFAELLGTDTTRVSHALERLMRDGRIARIGAGLHRNFKCTLTGKQTGAPRTNPPQKQRTLKARERELGCERGILWRQMPGHVWYGGRNPDGKPIGQ